MTKKDYIILVDMDDTIEGLLQAWTDYLCKRYNLNIHVSEVTDWKMENTFTMLTPDQIYSPLVDEDLWKSVKPFPGAVDALKRLVEEGFTVRICTASSPTSYALKMRYVIKKYFPFFDTRLHCICAHDKQLIKGNVLIDDNYNNLIGGSYKSLLYDRPYNRCYDDNTVTKRVTSWEEIYDWIEDDFEKEAKND